MRRCDVMVVKERDYFRRRVWSILCSVIESLGILRIVKGLLDGDIIGDFY